MGLLVNGLSGIGQAQMYSPLAERAAGYVFCGFMAG